MIEYLKSLMGHPNFVEIREYKGAMQCGLIPVFDNAIVLMSQVTAWFVDERKGFSLCWMSFHGGCVLEFAHFRAAVYRLGASKYNDLNIFSLLVIY